jgi:acetyl-CoA carboxylase biotin carboxylase subunit
MRLVNGPEDFEHVFLMAQKEALSAFGDGKLYVEKFIPSARHIEVQIAADREGNVVHFYERECSLQRRHQKLLEEAPAPGLDDELRERIGEAAVRGAAAIGYESVGTMEFLLDEDGNFYFMEMNTRIQVEHPVTEMVTDTDLIKVQILIAAGEPVPFTQDKIKLSGHAIEARINAEDPDKDFAPRTGEVIHLHKPGGPGVRVDSHIYQGYKVPPFYDSLLAKLITKGRDRKEAIAKMKRALDEFILEGIPTTIPFHRALMDDPNFVEGRIHTHFLEQFQRRRSG